MTKQPVKVLNLTRKDVKLKHEGWNSSSIRITPVKSQVIKDGGITKPGQNMGKSKGVNCESSSSELELDKFVKFVSAQEYNLKLLDYLPKPIQDKEGGPSGGKIDGSTRPGEVN